MVQPKHVRLALRSASSSASGYTGWRMCLFRSDTSNKVAEKTVRRVLETHVINVSDIYTGATGDMLTKKSRRLRKWRSHEDRNCDCALWLKEKPIEYNRTFAFAKVSRLAQEI